jgi:hypothetical protein
MAAPLAALLLKARKLAKAKKMADRIKKIRLKAILAALKTFFTWLFLSPDGLTLLVATIVIGSLMFCGLIVGKMFFFGRVPAFMNATCGTVAEAPAAGDGKVQITLNKPPADLAAFDGWDVKQMRIAWMIVDVAKQRGIPRRGWEIAIAVAISESTLHREANSSVPESYTYQFDNTTFDTAYDTEVKWQLAINAKVIGVYQQKAWWGSVPERMDPRTAVNSFFGSPSKGDPPGLTDIDGWESMGYGEAAQKVQVSDPGFPAMVEGNIPKAKAIIAKIEGEAPGDAAEQMGGCNGYAVNGPLRQRILQIAEGEAKLGYSEYHTGGPDCVKYWSVRPGVGCAAWCGAFVTWVWTKAGLPKEALYSDDPWMRDLGYTPTDREWAMKNNLWIPKGSAEKPQPGDAVIFDWEGDGEPDHIAIVTKYNADGTFEHVGGNEGDSVIGTGTRTEANVMGYIKIPNATAKV